MKKKLPLYITVSTVAAALKNAAPSLKYIDWIQITEQALDLNQGDSRTTSSSGPSPHNLVAHILETRTINGKLMVNAEDAIALYKAVSQRGPIRDILFCLNELVPQTTRADVSSKHANY